MALVLKIVLDPTTADVDGELPPMPERFCREIESMKRVRSPRVVSIVDGPAIRAVSRVDHLWYLEPFYPGGTLLDRIDTEGTLSRDRAVTLCLGLLEGVGALWSQGGLVHRDIKPNNIVFDAADEPVLIDLGIAFDSGKPRLTRSSASSPRTHAFAAPEQLAARRDAQLDVRTDLFLVGLTVAWAWTGIHPFDPTTPGYEERLESGTLTEAFRSARGVDPFAGVLARLLMPHLHERFRTPGDSRIAVLGAA